MKGSCVARKYWQDPSNVLKPLPYDSLFELCFLAADNKWIQRIVWPDLTGAYGAFQMVGSGPDWGASFNPGGICRREHCPFLDCGRGSSIWTLTILRGSGQKKRNEPMAVWAMSRLCKCDFLLRTKWVVPWKFTHVPAFSDTRKKSHLTSPFCWGDPGSGRASFARWRP